MANKRITDFLDAGALQATDIIPVVRTGANYSITGWGTMAQQMSDAISVTGGTLTDVTITNPKMDNIYDSSSNLLLDLVSVASSTSYIQLASSSVDTPYVKAAGTSADIGLFLYGKGAGTINLMPGSGSNIIRLYNGANTIAASLSTASLTNNRTYTLPDSTGTFALVGDLVGVYQPLDFTLTNLASYNTNGLLTQTAADTFTGRTLTGTASEITVTNGDGVSGNPTVSLPSALTLTGKTMTGGTFGTANIVDTSFIIDNADATKKLAFECSGITTATTRTLTVPNSSGTIALTSDLVVAASQAEQETGSSTTVMVTPGRQQYHPSAAKAWLRCDASGGIIGSYNITSITDTGTGTLTVTIATDFSGNTWSGVATAAYTFNYVVNINTTAAGSCNANCTRGNTEFAADPSAYFFVFYGDQ